MKVTKLMVLKQRLEELHPGKDFFIGYQCGLVEAGHRGPELHDDTCSIICSDEYREAKDSGFVYVQ